MWEEMWDEGDIRRRDVSYEVAKFKEIFYCHLSELQRSSLGPASKRACGHYNVRHIEDSSSLAVTRHDGYSIRGVHFMSALKTLLVGIALHGVMIGKHCKAFGKFMESRNAIHFWQRLG
jgi:hypothetical protein